MEDDDGVDESQSDSFAHQKSGDFWGRCIPALLRYSLRCVAP